MPVWLEIFITNQIFLFSYPIKWVSFCLFYFKVLNTNYQRIVIYCNRENQTPHRYFRSYLSSIHRGILHLQLFGYSIDIMYLILYKHLQYFEERKVFNPTWKKDKTMNTWNYLNKNWLNLLACMMFYTSRFRMTDV